jgi:hypothetical protein
MSTGANIRQDSRIAITVQGYDFLCYRWTAGIALQALGPGVLNVVGDDVQMKIAADDIGKRYETIRKALKVLLLSPRLVDGETDDPDEVTWEDLVAADLPGPLFSEIVRESQERAANFPKSSGGQKA